MQFRSIAYRLALLPALLMSWPTRATEVGPRPYLVPVSAANPVPIRVLLSYPEQAAPGARFKGLIIISHGTGGSEQVHQSLAAGLAQQGYLVAALRHPGDNFEDRSVWQRSPGAFFTERPRQVSVVIDALLGDAAWKDRIPSDAGGPLIGVLGHSAGGFTAIALAGGQSDLSRIVAHCSREPAEDPLFCSMGRRDAPASALPPIPSGVDSRVRAVVALAPMGVVFTAASLAEIHIPVAVYAAAEDRWLVPRFHAQWIAQNIPGAQFHMVPHAWHFAFLDRPDGPVLTLDGDAAADPPGFDRAAFLAGLRGEVTAFFDQALTSGH